MDLSNVSPESVAALLGVLVPLLVSLFSKLNAPDPVKVVLNLGLTAVAGVLSTLATTDGTGFDVNGFTHAWVVAFVTAITTYYGLYKPAGVSTGIQNLTPNIGFGPGPAPTADSSGVQDDGADASGLVADESDGGAS
jgi:hypothetical protein